MLEKPRAW